MKPFVRYAAVFLLCAPGYDRAPILAQQQPKEIEIHAQRFSFTPAEIEITKGEKVTLTLTSEDATHGLSIPELGINASINKGKATVVELTPQQAGTFEGRCSHFCGTGHGSMVFSIKVKDQ